VSIAAVSDIIIRAEQDLTFRREISRSPDTALHGYDLTVAEREALIAGDETKLQQLGVAPDLSRMAAEFNSEESHLPWETSS